MVGSKHILATDENDAVQCVHAIKLFTIAVKAFKSFQIHIDELLIGWGQFPKVGVITP